MYSIMYCIGAFIGGAIVALVAYFLGYKCTSSKKKAIIIALIVFVIAAVFNYVKAGIGFAPKTTGVSEYINEDDFTYETHTFQDVNIRILKSYNFVKFDDVDVDIYKNYSRKDEDGFVDERLILSDDTPPTAIYCQTLQDPSVTIDDMLQYARDNGITDIEEISVGMSDLPGLKTINTYTSDGETYYYRDTLFIVNGKLYDIYSVWDNLDEINNTQDSIIGLLIPINE